ncbi:O-antigen ligase family protein [Pseudomonas sp. LS1212]|uniref:O-antigen ligase family protein n=1 Tax=Pseudomonas sp. LS1212 TaxID=2972478 RepID=UPI00215CD134|nr:O-antigen ligase family protein [Pseudomonas sp. LS1212]UVJ41843.1 O-antigen ligase family protein [Pseudomonas sp. LS1212]
MIIPLSVVSLFGLACLALLASPWPYLAPGVVLGLVGVAILYKRPAWGLLGIVALVPLEGLFKGSELSAAKLLGASLTVIIALQLVLRQIPAERLRSNLWRFLRWFLLAYLLSILCSDNLALSLGHLRELSVGLLLFVITLLVAREMNLDMFCRLVSLSVALTCALAMFSSKYQDQGRAAGMLEDPNAFAMLIAFAIPLALLQVLKSPSTFQRLGWIACSLLLMAGMTKTESRSGLVVLLISLGIGIYHYRVQLQRLRPRHLGFAMLAVAILVPTAISVMPPEYVERIKSLSVLKGGVNAHKDESLGRRASYILVGGQMIRENPLLGAGPGTFPMHYSTTGYAKAFSANRKASDLFRHAHNTYLEIFSEVGIPGGLLFVAMIAASLYNMLKARLAWLNRGEGVQANIVTHLGMGLLSLSLFLMFLSTPNQKYVWIMLALSSVLRLQAERSPQAQTQTPVEART